MLTGPSPELSEEPSSDGLTGEELAEQSETLRPFIEERTETLKDQV